MWPTTWEVVALSTKFARVFQIFVHHSLAEPEAFRLRAGVRRQARRSPVYGFGRDELRVYPRPARRWLMRRSRRRPPPERQLPGIELGSLEFPDPGSVRSLSV